MVESNFEKAKRTDDNIALIRGKLIGSTIAVERMIDFFITRHFNPENEIAFYENILLDMSFEKKIRITQTIVESAGLEVKDLIKRIRDMKNTRNKVAHWIPLYIHEGDDLVETKIDFFKSGKSRFHYSINDIPDFEKECRSIYRELTKVLANISRKSKK